MSKMIVPMVEILRGRSMEGIPEDFKGLSQTYENVCTAITKVCTVQ